MLHFNLILYIEQRKRLEKLRLRSQEKGDFRTTKRVMAILGFADGVDKTQLCSMLGVCEEAIRTWIKDFLLKGVEGLKANNKGGRPSKLMKSQKKELEKIIIEGPTNAGFSGNCWRSPMLQMLIYKRFGVNFSVYYIPQLLKNMEFSYQKAKFVSDHLDEQKRKEWLQTKWPDIITLSKKKNAIILFEDEVSFPQWGTLNYTWAKKGTPPVIKTSGIRKGYKIFGAIDYFSGRFLYKTHEGRFNSESYAKFLEEIMSKINTHIILIHDGAKYHNSKAMKEFFNKHNNRLTVYQLPSYSPDYNPIEKLWKKIKEKDTHLTYFPTFDSLKTKVDEALFRFENMQEEILSLFVFYNKLEAA